MDIEDLNRINTIIEEVRIRQERINDLYADSADLSKIHVERGRLIQYMSSNIKELQSLYDQYDMFMTVYEVINRKESDSFKINYIKNLIYKSSYTPFEEQVLAVINSNLDNIEEMKRQLDELDSNYGIRSLIDLRSTYSQELEKHRKNIDQRYKTEFLQKKTNLLSIVTMLPKAIGLSVKKVANCVKQVKVAKENKEKTSKVLSVIKAAGQTAITPVTFIGKFAIDHWYLVVIGAAAALGLFPKIGDFIKNVVDKFKFFFKKGKKKDDDDKNKDKKDGKDYGEKDYAKAPEVVPETNPAYDTVDDLVADSVPQTKPVEESVPATAHNSAINYAADPRFQAKPVEESVPATAHNSAINYAVDPRFQAKPNAVQNATDYTISQEEWSAISEINRLFIEQLELDNLFFIKSRHPEVQIVHSAKEFCEAVKSVNPTANITEENAELFYYNNLVRTRTRGEERNIVWPEAEANITYEDGALHYFENEQQFADYLMQGTDSALQLYYSQFVQSNGDLSLFGQIQRAFNNSAISETLKKAGITGTGAMILFCLYEAAQYGLAVPTYGASLALPF